MSEVASGPRSASAVDQVLEALADPTRRRLLMALGSRPASSATALAADLPVTRQAVAKHLATLEEAGLVTGHRVGREVLYRVEPDGLTATASWMTALARAWDERLSRLKREAETDTLGG